MNANAESETMDLRRLLPVASFTAAYMVAAILLALSLGNFEFLYYIAVMLLLIYVVYLVHKSVVLPSAVIWALSLWGFAHMAGGLVTVPEGWPIDSGSRVLYSLWLIPDYLKYDQVVHAYGFGVATWVCWHGLRAAIDKRGGQVSVSVGLMVICATAGMGLGALNELVEFLATLLIPETNVGGYLNTGWDLVANFVGAVSAAVIIYLREPRMI